MAAKTVNVIVVVDALAAVSSGNLGNNVYLIDTNKPVGSTQEGQQELYTKCYDGQTIQWRIEGISPDSDVDIVEFTGQIMNGVCKPSQQVVGDTVYWSGIVESQGRPANYQYSVKVSIDGKVLTFDPFLAVVKQG
jgi:hypothetical protein